MKKLMVVAALCCMFGIARAQTADANKPSPLPANGADPDGSIKMPAGYDHVFTKVSHPPHFPGGTDSLHRYLSRHLIYPPALLSARKGGLVTISFIVEKDGTLSQPYIQRSSGDAFDAAVLRVFNGTKFINGTQNGHAVRVMFNTVIRFDPDMPTLF